MRSLSKGVIIYLSIKIFKINGMVTIVTNAILYILKAAKKVDLKISHQNKVL